MHTSMVVIELWVSCSTHYLFEGKAAERDEKMCMPVVVLISFVRE